MKTILMAATLPALALLSACGGAGTTNTTANTSDMAAADTTAANDSAMMAGMDNAADPAMAPMTGQQFADTAAASDAYEIASSKLAQQKASSQGIKDFAKMLVTEHTESTAKLKAAAAKASPAVTPKPALTAEQQSNIAKLEAASGTEFDAQYKEQQIAAHTKTLAALQSYAASGDVPSLKAHAAATAPVVEKHLQAAQGL